MAYLEVGSDISIEAWAMVEHEATTVGTLTVTSEVHSFSLSLVQAELASKTGSLYRIDAGDALFHLGGSVDDVSDYVLARNSTNTQFYFVSPGVGTCPTPGDDCLVSRPFTISYTDAFDQDWELDIGSATWSR